MKASLHGSLSGPAIAVVGVWDPFLASHADLLERLRDHAIRCSCSSLGLLIDPSPGHYSIFRVRYGTSGWPVYDSVKARIDLMLGCGLDAVLCVRFLKRDFAATASDFLDFVRGQVQLSELWLGALQQLGVGPKGSQAAVAEYAARHRMQLTILPLPPLGSYDVRSFLASGHLADAIAVVGRPPIWTRPRSGELRLAWRPGHYRAIPLEQPSLVCEAPGIDVTLVSQQMGPARLSWPRPNVKYLAFTSGPHDQAAVEESTSLGSTLESRGGQGAVTSSRYRTVSAK